MPRRRIQCQSPEQLVAKFEQHGYIDGLSLLKLEKLFTDVQTYTTNTAAQIKHQQEAAKEMKLLEKKIKGFGHSMESILPQNLKELAEKQLAETTDAIAVRRLEAVQYDAAMSQRQEEIRARHPKYDFAIDDEMLDYITSALVSKREMQERAAQRKKLEQEKRNINEKLQQKYKYVVNKVIPFLLEDYRDTGYEFVPEMGKLNSGKYLDELIKEAHSEHYTNLCDHLDGLDEYKDSEYIIDESSIEDIDGWKPSEEEYDDRGNLMEQCNDEGKILKEPRRGCDRRYAIGVSVDIFKFKNYVGFDLESVKCQCSKVEFCN